MICCTVVSIVPFEIFENKPGLIPPSFRIPKSDGKIPSILKITTCSHFVYLDESRGMLQVKNPPDVVAKSIVEDYCSSQLGVDLESGPGLFWIDDEVEVEELLTTQKYKIELARLEYKQRRWFMNVTKMADDDWRKYHQHNVISDFQRNIGEFLGLNPREHEWMSPLSMLKDTSKACIFCSSQIPKEAIVCSVCNRVVDTKREEKLLAQQKG